MSNVGTVSFGSIVPVEHDRRVAHDVAAHVEIGERGLLEILHVREVAELHLKARAPSASRLVLMPGARNVTRPSRASTRFS